MQKTKFPVVWVTYLVLVVVVITFLVSTGFIGNTRQYMQESAAHLINSLQHFQAKYDVINNAKGITMFKHVAINITGVTNMKTLEKIFVKHADRVDVHCGRVTRLGHDGDGGWNVCQANNYSLKKPCLVYSFGIARDWTFDDQVAKDYRCTIRAFDPSIKKPNHTHGDKFPVQFYNLGLGGVDYLKEVKDKKQKWTIRKFSTIYHELEKGEKPIVDFMKMDIEGSEYPAIIEMEKDGQLKYIKQIAFESHIKLFGIKKGVEILHVLERNGFRKWSAHVNMLKYKSSRFNRYMMYSCCYEFSYINTNFLDQNTINYLSIVAPYGYNAFD